MNVLLRVRNDDVPLVRRHATVEDIARELKISKATAAAALSGRGGNTRVSRKTVERVKEAARLMNYRSNASARAMSQQRFNTIGYFVAKKRADDSAVSDQIPLSIVDAAAAYGQNVLLVGIPTPVADQPVVPRSLSENCIDGLIVQNTTALSPDFHIAIESSRVPVVYLNEKAATNSVYIDDVESGRVMTDFLIEAGFRRIAMLSTITSFPHYSGIDRLQGYQEAIRRHRLKPILWSFPTRIWRDAVQELLRSPDRPDAIFCESDSTAMFLQRILYQLRLRVPEEIAIAGCNDGILSTHSTVPLTTLHIPFTEMARASVKLLMKLMESPGFIPSVILRPELVVRSSTDRVGCRQTARKSKLPS